VKLGFIFKFDVRFVKFKFFPKFGYSSWVRNGWMDRSIDRIERAGDISDAVIHCC